jgi:hypothetical protein
MVNYKTIVANYSNAPKSPLEGAGGMTNYNYRTIGQTIAIAVIVPLRGLQGC